MAFGPIIQVSDVAVALPDGFLHTEAAFDAAAEPGIERCMTNAGSQNII
jgi:hypothetical protein